MSISAAPVRVLHRVLAAGCAALVLALVVFGASPAAHTWVHSLGPAHGCEKHSKATTPAAANEHDCAIVMVAQGVESSLGDISSLLVGMRVEELARLAPAELDLASPRYLRQPERGPPVSRVG